MKTTQALAIVALASLAATTGCVAQADDVADDSASTETVGAAAAAWDFGGQAQLPDFGGQAQFPNIGGQVLPPQQDLGKAPPIDTKQPPLQQPPIQQPPVQQFQPPVQQPVYQQPPLQAPPEKAPPVEQPPVKAPPCAPVGGVGCAPVGGVGCAPGCATTCFGYVPDDINRLLVPDGFHYAIRALTGGVFAIPAVTNGLSGCCSSCL